MIAALSASILAGSISLSEYRERLSSIDALLARGDTARAATGARALLNETVGGEEEIAPDSWALGPIARGEHGRARLQALLAGLAEAPTPAQPAPDRELLAQLRREQQPTVLPEGGEITPLPAPDIPFMDRVTAWFGSAGRFIRRCFLQLLDWLGELFSAGAVRTKSASGVIIPLVLIGVGAILSLVAALAVLSLRRRPLAQRPAHTSAARAEDENPLSRSTTGWEARARELAAQGRAREAIRAWYHAVLVHCYGAGVLHYRRGRTNWEYAYALSPSLSWRPRFQDLTRSFDVEWYGHAESTTQALDAFADGADEILRALRRQG